MIFGFFGEFLGWPHACSGHLLAEHVILNCLLHLLLYIRPNTILSKLLFYNILKNFN